MQGLAEIEGNALRTSEAKILIQRDINPLAKEVARALNEMGREELFYQAPDIEGGANFDYSQMDSLIQSSDDLLRESQSILAETEQIGTSTLHQMGRQREQIENANRHVEAVRNVASQANRILRGLSRKALKNKLFLYILISVLAGANLYVLYCIYKKHHSNKTDNKP